MRGIWLFACVPLIATADVSVPGPAGARGAAAGNGIVGAGSGAGGGGGAGAGVRRWGLRAPAKWLGPCAQRMERAAGKIDGRRTTVVEDPDAETVTLERHCADGERRCGHVWALVSNADSRTGEGFVWTNHKNGAHTGSWDLRRRTARLEGWVEATGDGAAAALPTLTRAVDECLALE